MIKKVNYASSREEVEQYCDEWETNDDVCFKFFCEHSGAFTDLVRQQKGSRIDYMCNRVRKGYSEPCHCELKFRLNNINTFDSIYQDVEKMKAQLWDYIETGRIPYFVNFMQCKERVLIWDLRIYIGRLNQLEQWKGMPKNSRQLETKYKLPIREAHYLEYDEEDGRYKVVW